MLPITLSCTHTARTKRRTAIVVLLFSFLNIASWAQKEDSTYTPSPAPTLSFSMRMKKKWDMEHSPLKATAYSALLPGAGQLYNKKYWKAPIVWAGIGTCVYFIADNTRNYRLYRDAYIAENDADPSTLPQVQVNPEQFRDLNEAQNTYKRWLDISYMALAGVYVLQLIDANVDAHLFYFDVSPDLSLLIHPSIIQTERTIQGLTLSLQF
jgi:hypothetical protein